MKFWAESRSVSTQYSNRKPRLRLYLPRAYLLTPKAVKRVANGRWNTHPLNDAPQGPANPLQKRPQTPPGMRPAHLRLRHDRNAYNDADQR